ncbi:MAG: S8 family peptidase [Hyphomicrobiaceae bacterium]|nr:S8 family peptidase [Hyphomicrobiaceae bacterium]
MPKYSIPAMLPRNAPLLSGLFALMLSVPAFMPSQAQAQAQAQAQTNTQTTKTGAKLFGGEILRQQPALPSLGRYYYPNRLIVSFKKGVDGQQLMNELATERRESSADRKDLQLALELAGDLPALVTIKPPNAEKESTGQLPYMMLEQPGKESGGSLNWLMARLKASDKVKQVSRDYVLFSDDANTDRINDLLGGAPTKPTNVQPRHPAIAHTPALIPNDRFYKLQWHLKLHGSAHNTTTSPGASGFPLAWALNPAKNQPIVAILDTGLYYEHEDIKNNPRILPGYDFISDPRNAKDGDGIDNDPSDPGTGSEKGTCASRSAEVDGWHGTHVAGLAGAMGSNNRIGATGGAWHIRILPVRVLGRCGGGSLRDIMRGMLWAGGIAQPGVPDNLMPADIINLSLSAQISCTPLMQTIVNTLKQRGVTIIASAGNDGVDAAGTMPANCNNVIAVAASDARGHLTPYSNFGEKVDIMAPGGDLSRDDNGDKFADGMLSAFKGGYKFYQGTSQAAPMVAAAAALIKSHNPGFGPDQLLATLKKTAHPRSKKQCPKACGAGLLNLAPLAAKKVSGVNKYR